MNGWIKLPRDIQDHWLYKDPIKLFCWIDILFTVNYEDKKVLIGNQLYECKRGQSLLSLQAWADRWKMSKSAARNVIFTLEDAHLLRTESVTRSTRITVCEYDSYPESAHDQRTTSARPAHERHTQLKKDKEIRSKNITLPNGNVVGLPEATQPILSYEDRCKKFIDKFNSLKVVNKKPGKFQVTGMVRTKLKARLMTYTPDQIIGAIKNAMLDKNHIEKNWIYLTPEYILREEIIERYINADMTERREYYNPGSSGTNDDTRFEPIYNPHEL